MLRLYLQGGRMLMIFEPSNWRLYGGCTWRQGRLDDDQWSLLVTTQPSRHPLCPLQSVGTLTLATGLTLGALDGGVLMSHVDLKKKSGKRRLLCHLFSTMSHVECKI